jgi:hypothetical protein
MLFGFVMSIITVMAEIMRIGILVGKDSFGKIKSIRFSVSHYNVMSDTRANKLEGVLR